MSTLLLIEDHAPLRRNLRDMLIMDGFEVMEAADGAEGLRLAPQAHLILCDIMLPLVDGLEVLATLRGNPNTRHLPFIFLTAKGEPPDVRAGMNLGADDYLSKPVSRVDLLASIRARLERASQQRGSTIVDFSDAHPLESLGVSPREAEVLLWMAQGKGNQDIAIILDLSPATVKKHILHIFEKLAVESRGAAMLIAIETLSRAVM